MKKLLCIIFALVLSLGATFVLASCGEPEETTAAQTDPTPTAPATPDGYELYDNGKISFAYPSGWVKTDGSVVILTDNGGSGNNVTVAYEAKTDIYEKMTLESFNRDFKPAFEAMGMSISNAAVSQTKNSAGVEITKVTYNATMSGVSMKQTLAVLSVDEYTYTVTVTEVKSDATLVDNVLNTIWKLK